MNSPLVWKRFAAFVIDFLIVFMIVYTAFADILTPIVQSGIDKADPVFLYFFAVFSLLLLLYFVTLEKKLGQSIGKIFMNLFVVGKKVDGRSFPHLIRGAFLIPFFPFQLLLILDPLFMMFTKNNQRLMEIFSKTTTVSRRAS